MDYKAQEQGKDIPGRTNLLEENSVAKPSIDRSNSTKSKNKKRKNFPFSLKKIRQDEAKWNEIKTLSVYDFLGKPSFKNPLKIPENEIPSALEHLLNLCEENGISLVVRGYYPPKEIYSFLTTELFQWRTDSILQPDCICKLIYEDYHPNHKLSIEDVSKRFLELWLGRRLREFNFELTDVFVTSRGKIRTKLDVLSRMKSAFEDMVSINSASMYFAQVNYNWDEAENTGTGHAEGMLRYVAIMKDGSSRTIEGPFKFYLTNENNSWEVFYFVLPGFNW